MSSLVELVWQSRWLGFAVWQSCACQASGVKAFSGKTRGKADACQLNAAQPDSTKLKKGTHILAEQLASAEGDREAQLLDIAVDVPVEQTLKTDCLALQR